MGNLIIFVMLIIMMKGKGVMKMVKGVTVKEITEREKSFQIETILDTKMSEIYGILDEHDIPIGKQLEIHHEIVEMLNAIEG